MTGYIHYANLAGLSESTIRRRRTAIRLLIRDQTLSSPDELTRDRIEAWLAQQTNPQTRRSYLGDVRAFCRYLMREQILTVDPTFEIPSPRTGRRLPNPLTQTEVRTLRGVAVDPIDQAIVAVGLFCGLRVSEIGALDADDIDRHRRVLTVRQGKGSKDRAVPVALAVLDAVAHTGPAIGRRMAGPQVSKRIRDLYRLGGISGHRPHDLRSTFATEMLRQTGDVAMVSMLLGHSNLATTSRYVLVDAPGTNVVDGLFGGEQMGDHRRRRDVA